MFQKLYAKVRPMYVAKPPISVVSAPKNAATPIYKIVKNSPLPAVPIVNLDTVFSPK